VLDDDLNFPIILVIAIPEGLDIVVGKVRDNLLTELLEKDTC
jgi:hypothetical protein